MKEKHAQQTLKRLIDLLVAGVVLLVFAPIMMAIALLIRMQLGEPVLFRQQRPGLHGKPFTVLKFRTMTQARDTYGNLLPDVNRLTSLGRFLRITSLDELPQLVNVLKGDMSLVGPRPLLMKYLPYYSEQERTRFEVVPGMAGWAQVNGRNYLSWDERLAHDIWYVENWSLRLDFRILLLALWQVLRRADVQDLEALCDLDEERGHNPSPEIVL